MENVILLKNVYRGKEVRRTDKTTSYNDCAVHYCITTLERKCGFKAVVNTLTVFVQVLDTDFLKIIGLINTSNVLWRTFQASKSNGLHENMGF